LTDVAFIEPDKQEEFVSDEVRILANSFNHHRVTELFRISLTNKDADDTEDWRRTK